MKKIIFGFAIVASLISAFTGCELSADDNSQKNYTVTFLVNGKKTVVKADSDGFLLSSKAPSVSNDDNNYFLFWSESKESQDKVTKFELPATIEKDLTLYAIFTPKMERIEDFDSDNNQITIKLSGTNVYTLDDGSYAGLKLSHSTDDESWTDYALGLPANSEDEDDYRYLTYDLPFTPENGANLFKVTNGVQEYVLTDGIIPAPATGLTTEVNDRYAKLTFTTARFWTNYTVEVYEGSSKVASRSVTSTTKPTAKSEEFYGLKNNTDYTFKVTTTNTDQYASKMATPAIVKKESDWVVALYMDGDNNLHHPIWLDLNEAEYGLDCIRYSDDTPYSDYASVNVVALWDGAVSWKNDDGKTETPQIGKSGTYLYELGRDYGAAVTSYTSSGCVLSSNTKNLTYTADWIYDEDLEISNKRPNITSGEVNMGDKENLIKYLNWVNAHYTAKKGVILQFSDHGGGPRAVRYVQTKDGKTIKVGDTSERRALCWDDGSYSSFLKTADVSDALKAAGYGTNNKLSMILMDVCLGSSIEDAYQFKDYAEYLAASPNTIPGYGLNYTDLMKSFKSSSSIEDIGLQILKDYKKQYCNYTDWDEVAQFLGFDNYASVNNNQKPLLDWFGHFGITTFTITDLSKVDEVKTAFNSMCEVLLSEEGKAKTLYVDEKGWFSASETEYTQNYVSFLGEHHANIVNWLTTNGPYSYDDSIYYMGSYTWLYDIGHFTDMLRAISAATISGSANANAWLELNTAADVVIGKLDEAIKYSWHESNWVPSGYNNDFYAILDGNESFKHHYGLTISGANIAVDGNGLTQGSAPDYYKTDLAFGEDTAWGNLLEYWFNKD